MICIEPGVRGVATRELSRRSVPSSVPLEAPRQRRPELAHAEAIERRATARRTLVRRDGPSGHRGGPRDTAARGPERAPEQGRERPTATAVGAPEHGPVPGPDAIGVVLYLQPSQVELADRVDIKLSTVTGINVAKVQQIEAAVPTVLAINFSTAWVINDVEPGAAAVIGAFDVKANALVDLLRGRFAPKGRLPMSIPASQAAVDANASDIPGYLESFDYSYKNSANDTYIFGFGKSAF